MPNESRQYEAMFLFPQSASGDLQSAVDQIKSILARADAEIISLSKWDERRLAHTIKGNRRGVYFLTYFTATPDRLRTIEQTCNLSEQVLRAMVTRVDHLELEQMQAADGQAELADEIALRGNEDEQSEETAQQENQNREEPEKVPVAAGSRETQ